jgi:hypothetical protein
MAAMPSIQRVSRLALFATAAVASAMVTLPSATADAAPEVLRPGTRPWWFAGGFGPSIHVANSFGGRGRGGFGGFTQFMLTQEIGGHFSGEFEGPALGAHLSESFGSGVFRFTVGPRFWWDIQVVDDLGLYITPDAQIGYTLYSGFGTAHNVNLQFGAAGRLILGDRGMVFARIVAFDFNFGDIPMILTYNLILGGGVTW